MLTKEEMPACPVATTVQLIGSKWKLLILRNLRVRPWRFNELRKDLEDRLSGRVQILFNPTPRSRLLEVLARLDAERARLQA